MLSILFELMLAFLKAILCGNVAASILVLSTEKWYSNSLKKVLHFQKTCFKVKRLKPFKISGDFTYKYVDLLKVRLFWKSLVPLFRGTYALSVGYNLNSLQRIFSLKKTKSPFAVKFAERDHTFSVCLMNHLFEYLALTLNWTRKFYNYDSMESWNFNRLCEQ